MSLLLSLLDGMDQNLFGFRTSGNRRILSVFSVLLFPDGDVNIFVLGSFQLQKGSPARTKPL
jgi:hypothetical protein